MRTRNVKYNYSQVIDQYAGKGSKEKRMDKMTRLEFLTVMKSLLIVLKAGKTDEAITLIEELVQETQK